MMLDDFTIFDSIKDILVKNGWKYYPNENSWSSENLFKKRLSISENFLARYSFDLRSIYFCIVVLDENVELFVKIMKILPKRYFRTSIVA